MFQLCTNNNNDESKSLEFLVKVDYQLVVLSRKLEILEERLKHDEDILERSGAEAKTEMIEQMDELTGDEKYYCQTFYNNLSNLLYAYKILSTGLVTGDIAASTKDQAILLAAEGLIKLAGIIPGIAGLTNVIDDGVETIYNSVQQAKFISSVNAVNKVLQNKCNIGEDIDTLAGTIALAVTKLRSAAIRDTASDIYGVGDKLELVQEWLNGEVLDSVALYDIKQYHVQLALNDSTLLVVYVQGHCDEIIKNPKKLHAQSLDIINSDVLGTLLSHVYDYVLASKSFRESIDQGKNNLNIDVSAEHDDHDSHIVDQHVHRSCLGDSKCIIL